MAKNEKKIDQEKEEGEGQGIIRKGRWMEYEMERCLLVFPDKYVMQRWMMQSDGTFMSAEENC